MLKKIILSNFVEYGEHPERWINPDNVVSMRVSDISETVTIVSMINSDVFWVAESPDSLVKKLV